MGKKLKVLFIAPMEDMQKTALDIGQKYEDIDLTVLVGNEQEGRRQAQEHYANNYDCIISRGNTAAMIRSAVTTPVIDIKVSLYDVLASLEVLEDVPSQVAAVGYSSTVEDMEVLTRFLPFEMEVHGFSHVEETAGIFASLKQKGIQVMVCDAITCELARKQGFHACLLRSGATSVRYAFEQARHLYQTNLLMLEENQLLRRMVSANRESETVIFSESGRLHYSTLSKPGDGILEYLKEHLFDFAERDQFRMVKQTADYFYRISAQKITTTSAVYFAYFLSRRAPNMNYRHKSIRYLADRDVEADINHSAFGIAGIKDYYSIELNRALKHRSPVMIYGEIGVGKNQLAEWIYLNSAYRKNPFVVIDCSLISKQTWQFLIHKNDSPLCDNGHTLFIKNIDALDQERLRELLAVLIEGDVVKRNRLLLSCSATRGLSPVSSLPVLKVVNQLECLTISMAPLRGQYETIRSAVERLLADFRSRINPKLGNLHEDALTMLLYFSWPRNYDQLIRVVAKVATLAGDGDITAQIVSDALNTEMNFVKAETEQTGNIHLDLSKPLGELDKDIAKIVIEQHGGNHSAAAKSLGISRTTLWRMVKETP